MLREPTDAARVDRRGDLHDRLRRRRCPGRPTTSGTPSSPDSRERRVERHAAEQRHAELDREPVAAAGAEHVRASCSRPRRRARRPVFCAIVAAREATSCASGCGVVTTTVSARGSSWPSEIETSPVPGGMSTTSTSSSPQCTSCRNCSNARCSIGPRHITGWLSSRKNPIDISFRSCATGGTIILSTTTGFWSDAEHVRDRVAVDVGVEDADLVPERGERRRDVDRQRRLADAALARRDRDHARRRRELDAACTSAPPRSLVVSAARSSGVITSNASVTDATPGSAADVLGDLVLEARAERAADDGQRDRHRDVGAVDLDARTMSSSVTGRRSSGSITRPSASRICSCVTASRRA